MSGQGPKLYSTEESRRDLGGYSNGVPPLPIPNREVKPVYADGTAVKCGRVGSRLFKELCKCKAPFFVCIYQLLVILVFCIFWLLLWALMVQELIDHPLDLDQACGDRVLI